MQETIRQFGADTMTAAEHQRFLSAHVAGNLVRPEDCGLVIAGLALGAPKKLSGSFVSWDSEECKSFR